MRKGLNKLQVFAVLFLTLALLMSTVSVSQAATTLTVNSKVYITQASYVQLTDASLIPSTSGATVSFTFTIFNGDNKSINLVDYWARLKSKGGSSYKLTLLDKESKKTVPPKSSVSLTFYSNVQASMTLDQLILNFIQFDFAVSGYEKTIGQFTFAKGYTNHVKPGGFKGIKIDNTIVNTRIDQVNVTKAAGNYNVNLSYVTRNTSQFGVPLPDYNYYMQTSKGLFKLKVKNTSDQNLTLEPTVLNSIRLSGTIPATVPTTGWKLIIAQKIGAAEAAQIELPVATFGLNVVVNNITVSTSKQTFTNDKGTYDVELQTVQRLPWSNEDNIIAKVIVKNKESVYLPLPDLNGSMIVDENITLTSQTIKNSGDIGIAPGGSTTLTFIGKLPYDYNWKKFKLALNEKSGESNLQVAELTNSNVASIYSINAGSVYKQLSNGSQMSVVVKDTRTYIGENNDIYAVYIDVTNDQSRSTLLPMFTGYFKSAAGNYYEAKVVKSANAINPANKEQLMVYTELPRNVSTEGLQLLLGEAFDANGLIKVSTGTPTGYLRAVLFGLPGENNGLDSFTNIKVGPYNVDLNYFNVFATFDTLEIDLGSLVTKDYSYEAFSQSKLLFELEYEPLNDVIWSQIVDIEGKSEGSLKWKNGENYVSISKPMTTDKYWSSYTLNVYDTFNGFRKLLYSKDIKFSSTINWLDGNN